MNSKPFARASIWRILLILICWGVLMIIVYSASNIPFLNGKFADIASIGTLGLLLAIFIELKLKGIKLYSYITPNEKKEWKLLYIFIPLIISALGFGWLYGIILYNIAPDYFQNQYLPMINDPIFTFEDGFWHITILVISASIAAPFAEEFLFRGIIFDKLRSRWSVLVGLIASSFIFGVFHFDILGAFLFGVVLCILYLETDSLFAPIGIHFFNNLTVFLLVLIVPEGSTKAFNLNYLFVNIWVELTFLLTGASWITWFIYSRRTILIKEMKPQH